MPSNETDEDRVAALGQVDPRRPPGRPYFEPAGAAALDRQLDHEHRNAADHRAGAGLLDTALRGDWFPRSIEHDPARRPEDLAEAIVDDLERALDAAVVLLGPAAVAGITGAPVTGRDERRQQTPGRLETLRRLIRDVAEARWRHAARADRAELEVERLADELGRAQAAHDARTSRETFLTVNRRLAEARADVRYLDIETRLVADVARRLDRLRTGDARTAGAMLHRARREAAVLARDVADADTAEALDRDAAELAALSGVDVDTCRADLEAARR